jgi:hypothetical protein
MSLKNSHLTQSTITGKYTQFITCCLVCGCANSVSDCAGQTKIKASRKRFEGEHEKCATQFTAAAIVPLKAKIAEIQSSAHVASVEIALEEEFYNVRIYSATTNDSGVPHLYTIRVEDSFEDGTPVTTAKCNCLAKGVCRHIQSVAKFDAAQMDREIYPNELAGYQAYKSTMRRAA